MTKTGTNCNRVEVGCDSSASLWLGERGLSRVSWLQRAQCVHVWKPRRPSLTGTQERCSPTRSRGNSSDTAYTAYFLLNKSSNFLRASAALSRDDDEGLPSRRLK